MRLFKDIQIQHVLQSQNQEADALASEQWMKVIVGAIRLKLPLFQGSDIVEEILCFLMKGEFTLGMTKSQRQWLACKATRYCLINDNIYCLGKDQVLWRVPLSIDIQDILASCHEGVCGGHFALDITSRKILQANFVWPSLHWDVHHWCETCHECQRAGDKRLTYEPQTPILLYGPFEKWGIDAIGAVPQATLGKRFIIVGVDYMTRWAEAVATTSVTAK